MRLVGCSGSSVQRRNALSHVQQPEGLLPARGNIEGALCAVEHLLLIDPGAYELETVGLCAPNSVEWTKALPTLRPTFPRASTRLTRRSGSTRRQLEVLKVSLPQRLKISKRAMQSRLRLASKQSSSVGLGR